VGTPTGLNRRDLTVTAVSLGTMIIFNVWTKGSLRVFCALIGMVVGYVAAALAGILTVADLSPVKAAPVFHFPRLGSRGVVVRSWPGDSVRRGGAGRLSARHGGHHDVPEDQRRRMDAAWHALDQRRRAANGLATATAGICGTIGVNTLTS
jgi:xanthine/uracil permease